MKSYNLACFFYTIADDWSAALQRFGEKWGDYFWREPK